MIRYSTPRAKIMGNQLAPRPEPIRVYLDSSDIDNLTDARKLAKDARLGETAEVLKELAAKGIAEFRFSFFHVIELAHADDVSKPFALRRVELVKALCGPKAFLNADELWRLEALSLCQDNEPEPAKGAKARVFVEDASWLPRRVVDVAYQLVDSLIRRLKKRIGDRTEKALEEIGTNRKSRRGMKRRLLGRRGVSAHGAEIAATTPDLFLADWKQALPLTKRFWEENFPLQYLNKQISLDALRAECVAGFGDLDNFIGWCIELPMLSELPKTIRRTDQAQNFDELRADARERERLAESLLELLEPEAHVHHDILRELHKRLHKATIPSPAKSRPKDLERLYASNREWFTRRGVSNQDWENEVLASPLGALPGMDMMLQLAGAQFEKLASLSKDARKLRRSDVSDLLHSQYLPYVDLFRADNYTRSLIGNVAMAKRTKLVPSTLALPDMLREEARARHLI
jgi:hypothetical protein